MPDSSAFSFLHVDLTSGRIESRPIPKDIIDDYIGGRGLGIRLLYDHTRPGLDPFDPDMALVFSIGPLTSTAAPQSNRFVVTTKSPLTGLLADSHCGGNFASALRRAGYLAVLIHGQSPKPVYLKITEQAASILDASHLWGQGTRETQAALDSGFGKAVIGPAGENRVRFASIVSQTRFAGRTGTGAVMGAKNLKAVIAHGTRKAPIAHQDRFRKLTATVRRRILAHPNTGGVLPDLGTANLVMTTAGRNIIPTRNFQAGRDLRTPQLSGEKMRDELLVKNDGCAGCPIRCGRRVRIHGRETKGPEFETLGLMGNNLGNFDLPAVVELGELCDDLGLDTISMGGTLALATELTERGLLESNLAWGNIAAYRQAILDTAQCRGLGAELAHGSRRLALKYNAEGIAIQVKGLELPAYDPRGAVGQGLEYATSNRGGCHMRGTTVYLEAIGPVSVDPLSPRSKPELVVFAQNLNAAVSSLVMCYFSFQGFIPGFINSLKPHALTYRTLMRLLLHSGSLVGLVLKARSPLQITWFEKLLSAVAGQSVSFAQLLRAGERIFNLERLYNLREGLDPGEDTLPERLLSESTSRHGFGGVPLGRMLPAYYRLRGWDESGRPTEKTIQRLRIRN